MNNSAVVWLCGLVPLFTALAKVPSGYRWIWFLCCAIYLGFGSITAAIDDLKDTIKRR